MTHEHRRCMSILRILATAFLLVGALGAAAAMPPEAAAAGAAYNAYLKDVKKADFDAVMAATVPEKAAQMKQHKSEKDFPAMWGIFTSMHPSAVKVTDARRDGAKLVLTVEVTEGDKSTGTIEMQQIGGKWLVGQESYKGTMGEG